MSAAIQVAAVQHALDVAQLYKDNCALARGIPQALPRLHVGEDPKPQPAMAIATTVQPLQPHAAQPVVAQLVDSQPKQTDWIVPTVLTVASLLGGAGFGGVATYLLSPRSESTTVIQQPQDASLLQYLEDQGLHLPAEKRGTP